MKKLLFFAVLLLSGCASDLTKYPRYNVTVPQAKASLFIAKPDNYLDKWYQEILNSPIVKQAWQKYFIKSDERHADFILKQTQWKDNSSGLTSTALLLTVLSGGIIPSWAKAEYSYSYTLTRTKTEKTVFLSDVNTTSRMIGGWLLLPTIFSSDVYFMDDNSSFKATANAIEEAASLVYNENSKLYQKTMQKKWGAPVAEEPAQDNPAASVSAPVAPATPEDMDAAW
ncbi:MAG: hypothetical protein J5787_08790 [Alphaproteobacteria bacterium]|nr:hypothetical protein [Alphaproteobacteria bacterium]